MSNGFFLQMYNSFLINSLINSFKCWGLEHGSVGKAIYCASLTTWAHSLNVFKVGRSHRVVLRPPHIHTGTCTQPHTITANKILEGLVHTSRTNLCKNSHHILTVVTTGSEFGIIFTFLFCLTFLPDIAFMIIDYFEKQTKSVTSQ